jgi:hypothetical protein
MVAFAAQRNWAQVNRSAPIPSAFETWVIARHYDTTPAVCPSAHRIYADRHTQALYDAWFAAKAEADARLAAATNLVDAALHFKLDPRAARCLNAALRLLPE